MAWSDELGPVHFGLGLIKFGSLAWARWVANWTNWVAIWVKEQSRKCYMHCNLELFVVHYRSAFGIPADVFVSNELVLDRE